MHNIVAFYQAIPTSAWEALFGGGSLAAVIVEVIKRLVRIKQVPKNWVPLTIHALTTFMALAVSYLPILLNHKETFAAFGAYSATIFAGANILYSIAKAALPVLQSISSKVAGLFPKKAVTDTSAPVAVETPTYEG